MTQPLGPKTRAVLAAFATRGEEWLSDQDLARIASSGDVVVTVRDIEILIERGYLQLAYASGFRGTIATPKGKSSLNMVGAR